MSDSKIDWPGLLKWSMAYQDGTRDSDLKEMSDEDKQFIINAMDSMVMDEMKRIKVLLQVVKLPEDRESLKIMLQRSREAIEILDDRERLKSVFQMRQAEEERKRQAEVKAHSETDAPLMTDQDQAGIQEESTSTSMEERIEGVPHPVASRQREDKMNEVGDEEVTELVDRVQREKIEALDEMNDRVGKIDNAIALINSGGLPILRSVLRSINPEIRSMAAQVISTVVQNNPVGQTKAVHNHIVQTLLANIALKMPEGLVLSNAEEAVDPNSPLWPVAILTGPRFSATWTDQSGNVVNFTPVRNDLDKKGMIAIKSVLYALTSLINNNPLALQMFLGNGGVRLLAALIALDIKQVLTELYTVDEENDAAADHATQDKINEIVQAYIPVRRRAVQLFSTITDIGTSTQIDPSGVTVPATIGLTDAVNIVRTSSCAVDNAQKLVLVADVYTPSTTEETTASTTTPVDSGSTLASTTTTSTTDLSTTTDEPTDFSQSCRTLCEVTAPLRTSDSSSPSSSSSSSSSTSPASTRPQRLLLISAASRAVAASLPIAVWSALVQHSDRDTREEAMSLVTHLASETNTTPVTMIRDHVGATVDRGDVTKWKAVMNTDMENKSGGDNIPSATPTTNTSTTTRLLESLDDRVKVIVAETRRQPDEAVRFTQELRLIKKARTALS